MLAKLLLYGYAQLSLNQDIHWREGTTLVMLEKLPRWVCFTLFESGYTLKGRYNIGSVGKTASIWVCSISLNQWYTLKGRHNIGNVGKTASMSMLTLFESIYTLKGRYNIGNVGKLLLWVCSLSLNQDIHWGEGTTLVMLAKLLLWVYASLYLNQDIH